MLSEAVPDSAGVSAACAADTLVAPYNDITGVESLFEKNRGQIAAIIVEPVAANMGVVLPAGGFLQKLREICTREGALLVFEEGITGFRRGLDGAQGAYGVTSDICCFGKIIGGGMPVGAYGGRRDIMEMVSPSGPVYQAGTLSGHPVAMAAGIAQLSYLRDHREVYQYIAKLGETLFSGLNSLIQKYKAPCSINFTGSIGSLFFTKEKVIDLDSARTSDTDAYAAYFRYMLEHGVYQAPAQFEALFISAAHTEAEISQTLETAESFFKKTYD
jgi:glutamate-1-semialdehyde 2,1-aminomutase